MERILIAEYTYDLPENSIAKFPLAQRETSKLLVFKDGEIAHKKFTDCVDLLPQNSLLIFNNTRVVQARLLFSKTAGAKPIEVFCLEPFLLDVQSAMAAKNEVLFTCLVGNAKRWNDGLLLAHELFVHQKPITLQAEKVGREGDAFVIKFTWNGDATFAEVLENAGKVPLPPYLKRDSELADKERYQTVYAKKNGSVAAPTAGLHFTVDVLHQLKSKGVRMAETTLHVGAGTFKPVGTADVREHDMHAEEIHITVEFLETLLNHQGPRFCVGTTSARTLESLYWLGVKCAQQKDLEHLKLEQWDAYNLPQDVPVIEALSALRDFIKSKSVADFFTQTQLIITPGYRFKMIDGLFTNFHQPGSTLILLVAAAVGDAWKKIYAEALANNYRFLSYGDSSLLFIQKAV